MFNPDGANSGRNVPDKDKISNLPCDKMNHVVQLSHYPNCLNSVIKMDGM